MNATAIHHNSLAAYSRFMEAVRVAETDGDAQEAERNRKAASECLPCAELCDAPECRKAGQCAG